MRGKWPARSCHLHRCSSWWRESRSREILDSSVFGFYFLASLTDDIIRMKHFWPVIIKHSILKESSRYKKFYLKKRNKIIETLHYYWWFLNTGKARSGTTIERFSTKRCSTKARPISWLNPVERQRWASAINGKTTWSKIRPFQIWSTSCINGRPKVRLVLPIA